MSAGWPFHPAGILSPAAFGTDARHLHDKTGGLKAAQVGQAGERCSRASLHGEDIATPPADQRHVVISIAWRVSAEQRHPSDRAVSLELAKGAEHGAIMDLFPAFAASARDRLGGHRTAGRGEQLRYPLFEKSRSASSRRGNHVGDAS